MKSETIGKLAEALATAQSEMDAAHKDSKNPFFKSTYAKLPTIIDAIRPALNKNGLAYTCLVEERNGTSYLVAELLHKSGEWISSDLKLINPKGDMQGAGSAITYAKRFLLAALSGLSEEDSLPSTPKADATPDDDGNCIANNQAPSPPKPPKPDWHPGPLENEHIMGLMNKNKVSPADVTTIIKRFKKNRVGELDEDEYSKLCHVIATTYGDKK